MHFYHMTRILICFLVISFMSGAVKKKQMFTLTSSANIQYYTCCKHDEHSNLSRVLANIRISPMLLDSFLYIMGLFYRCLVFVWFCKRSDDQQTFLYHHNRGSNCLKHTQPRRSQTYACKNLVTVKPPRFLCVRIFMGLKI